MQKIIGNHELMGELFPEEIKENKTLIDLVFNSQNQFLLTYLTNNYE